TQPNADNYYAAIDPDEFPAPLGFTVSSADGTNVTGSGFQSFFQAGDIIKIPALGQQRTIQRVTSDINLVVWAPFTPFSNQAYIRKGVKTTFSAWQAANGFSVPWSPGNPDTAEAIYFNDGDLGFGRWMNMRHNANGTAYYVSDYKDVDKAIFAKTVGDPT